MEQVFCIARKDLEAVFASPLPNGAMAEPSLNLVLDLPHHFIARPEAETDPAYKQVIPYQLFCCQGRYFSYRRGGGVGEQRLAQRCSLGIGGHLNLEDSDRGRMGITAFGMGLTRERNEELVCQGHLDTRFMGWINDDSDPVGQVHIGAVHLCTVREPGQIRLRPCGEDLHALGWLRPDEIMANAECFEPWSLLALELTMR